MTLLDDFLDPRPKGGSAQCGRCGKFCRVFVWKDEGAPMTAEVPIYYPIVDCKAHGRTRGMS